MGKTRDRHIKGRLVPTAGTIEHRAAAISTRPLRLAFIIHIDTPKAQLLKYLEYNAIIWGGFYNVFIPSDGQTLREDWWRVLTDHDPDGIILCGEISSSLTEEICTRIQPYHVWEWSDDVAENHRLGVDGLENMPMWPLMFHLYQSSRPISQSNVRIPQIESGYPYREYVTAQFGALPEEYVELCTEALQGKFVKFDANDFSRYLTCLAEFEGRLSPIQMTKSYLSTTSAGVLDTGFTIVLVGDTYVPDFCLFSNLRMQPPLASKGTFVFPISVLRSRRNLEALADWCNEIARGTNHITLASATVDKRRLVRLKERLKDYLDPQIEIVDIWFSEFRTSRFRAHDAEIREELVLEDRGFRFKTPRPSFGEHIRGGRWVVDIDLGEKGPKATGYLPPRYARLNSLLCGNPADWLVRANRGFWLRLANEQLSCRVNRITEYIRGKLPTDEELFISLLRSKGYEAVTTDRCRYAAGIIGVMGGLQELEILRNPRVRDLFYAMQDGTAYTPGEMMSFLKPDSKPDDHERAHSLIADLAIKRVLLRGYKIKCPACDLTRWYPASDIAEVMPCAGCLTQIQPPTEAPFHYRLNELVARGIDQGAMPVLLTVLFLQALARASFVFVPGIAVRKKGHEVDLDLVASCDGYLILVECKDLKALSESGDKGSIKEICDQLTDVAEVAQQVGAEVVFLSALLESVPPDLQRCVDDLDNRLGKEAAVHLVTRAELEPEHERTDTPLNVRDFLPPTAQNKESGWIREPGTRVSTF